MLLFHSALNLSKKIVRTPLLPPPIDNADGANSLSVMTNISRRASSCSAAGVAQRPLLHPEQTTPSRAGFGINENLNQRTNIMPPLSGVQHIFSYSNQIVCSANSGGVNPVQNLRCQAVTQVGQYDGQWLAQQGRNFPFTFTQLLFTVHKLYSESGRLGKSHWPPRKTSSELELLQVTRTTDRVSILLTQLVSQSLKAKY